MEIVITVVIVAIAIYLLYNNFNKKKNGGCSCGSCTSKCPRYKK